MEDLKEKLKQAFAIGKNKSFRGSGNRLGTAEESGSKPDTRFNARAADLAGRSVPGPSTSAAPASPSRPSASRPAGTASNVASTSQTAPIPDGPAAAALARAAAGPAGSRLRAAQAPRAAPLVPSSAPTDEEVERISVALTLLLSCDNSDLACSTLHKILSNIVNNPAEAKYRTLRLSNPKIQEAVVANPGGLDLLAAVGFHLHVQDVSASEGIAALQPGADLLPLRVALKYLGNNAPATVTAPAPTAQASTSAAATLPPEPPAPAAPVGRVAPQPDPQPSTSYNPTPAPQPAAPSAPPAPPIDAQGPPPAATPPPAPSSDASHSAPPQAAPAAPQPGTSGPPPATEPVDSASLAGGAAPSVPAAASVRETKVLMPVHVDTEVPDWFFERTAAEVKVEYLQMTKRNDAARQLQTRAQREVAQLKAGGKRPRGPQPASVRVRSPDGVCVQATFQPQEPLTAVFEWVTAALRRPDLQYELVLPSRRPLGVAGQVAEADLAPSVLLNLHVASGDAGGEPVFADEVLARAQLAWGGGDAAE